MSGENRTLIFKIIILKLTLLRLAGGIWNGNGSPNSVTTKYCWHQTMADTHRRSIN